MPPVSALLRAVRVRPRGEQEGREAPAQPEVPGPGAARGARRDTYTWQGTRGNRIHSAFGIHLTKGFPRRLFVGKVASGDNG